MCQDFLLQLHKNHPFIYVDILLTLYLKAISRLVADTPYPMPSVLPLLSKISASHKYSGRRSRLHDVGVKTSPSLSTIGESNFPFRRANSDNLVFFIMILCFSLNLRICLRSKGSTKWIKSSLASTPACWSTQRLRRGSRRRWGRHRSSVCEETSRRWCQHS